MRKLALVSTHPIQYNAPLFALLAAMEDVELKVFYTWSQAKETVKDRTFGRDIVWDIPLLESYDFEFVENVARNPGSHHFFGIDNPGLIKSIAQFKPEAILIFGWSFKSHLNVLRYFKGRIPVWFRGDSTLLDEVPGIKTVLRRHFLRWVYKHVDKAFYVGKANKAYFLKHGLEDRQLVYAPHAVNNKHFTDAPEKAYTLRSRKWRKELDISEDQLSIVFAGKFEPKKQPDLLIDAVLQANRKRKDPLVLIMIGNGPLEQSLKAKARGQQNIRILPFQNQSLMPVVYRLGSVFCLPSKGPGETWGLAVNEAMACGVPVIVSDKVGGSQDLVVHGSNGYCFDHSCIEDLVSLLEDVSLNRLKEMGARARFCIEDFSLAQIAKAIHSELNKLPKT